MSNPTAVALVSQEHKEEVTTTHEMFVQVIEASSLPALTARKPGRPPTLGSLQLCLGIVLHFLRGWGSQLDLWRSLCSEAMGGFAPVKVCDQAVYHRLDTAAGAMRAMFEQVSHTWWERSPSSSTTLAPFAQQVLAEDESTLDRLSRWLPALRTAVAMQKTVLAGRISALFDVRRHQWVRVDVLEEAKANSKAHARAMLEGLKAGTLLLFDRGDFGFEWFDQVNEQGLWWVSRYANRASYQVLWVCYQGDGVLDAVIQRGAYRADQARHRVRLVSFWHRGQHYRYLTTVLDAHVLPLRDIALLYARRWEIEMAFRLLKDYLHLGVLWSAKWSVLQVQLWATLLLAQVYHATQHQVACQAAVDEQDVSMELLVRWVPRLLARGVEPVNSWVKQGVRLGFLRPSRRVDIQTPCIDERWVQSAPPEVLHPVEQVRHAHRKCEPRSQRKL